VAHRVRGRGVPALFSAPMHCERACLTVSFRCSPAPSSGERSRRSQAIAGRSLLLVGLLNRDGPVGDVGRGRKRRGRQRSSVLRSKDLIQYLGQCCRVSATRLRIVVESRIPAKSSLAGQFAAAETSASLCSERPMRKPLVIGGAVDIEKWHSADSLRSCRRVESSLRPERGLERTSKPDHTSLREQGKL